MASVLPRSSRSLNMCECFTCVGSVTNSEACLGTQGARDLLCVHTARGELQVCSRGQVFSIFDFPKQLSTCLSLQAMLSVFQASAV